MIKHMQPIKVAHMELSHLEQVYEIEVNSFVIPWTKQSIRKEIEDNELAIYIVAMDGKDVVGYAGMWHVVTEGHITNVAIKEEYRHKGIGFMLMEKMLEIAEQKEMVGVTLELRMGNTAAMNLYKKCGFKIEGLRKNYYSDPKEDAIIMWKYI